MLGVNNAAAAVTEGPRLAFMQWDLSSTSLATMDPSGLGKVVLYRDSRRTLPQLLPFESPAWLPDGSGVAFAGLTSHRHFNTQIFLLDGESGPPRPIPGTEGGMAPVFSPDGKSLAFARRRERTRIEHPGPGELREFAEFAVSTWVMDLEGGSPRQLTPWRYGVERYPSAFSPNGGALVVTRILNGGPPTAVALDLTGGVPKAIAHNAAGVTFSPDGTRIAYLGVGHKYRERGKDEGITIGRIVDIYVSRADGSRPLRLSHSPRDLETPPAWDPSGERLAFAQFKDDVGLFVPGDNTIFQVNADGTCKTPILSLTRATVSDPVWQPGSGREAGRIAC